MSELTMIVLFVVFGVIVILAFAIYAYFEHKRMMKNRALYDEQLARVLKVLRKDE